MRITESVGPAPRVVICANENQSTAAFEDRGAGGVITVMPGADGSFRVGGISGEAAIRSVAMGEWFVHGQWRVRVRSPGLGRPPDSDFGDAAVTARLAGPELLIATPAPEGVRRLRRDAPRRAGEQLVVGRSRSGADLPLDDDHISRRHARLFIDDKRLMVEDLGSRWGTTVNGARLTGPRELRHGDEVRMGKTVMHLVSAAQVMSESAEIVAVHAKVDAALKDEPRPRQQRSSAPRPPRRGGNGVGALGGPGRARHPLSRTIVVLLAAAAAVAAAVWGLVELMRLLA